MRAAGGAAANAATVAAGIDLATGLFGLDLDAALVASSADAPGARRAWR